MRLLVLSEGDEGVIWHAVERLRAIHSGPALCGFRPFRDWSEQEGDAITCPRCLRIMAVIEGKD